MSRCFTTLSFTHERGKRKLETWTRNGPGIIMEKLIDNLFLHFFDEAFAEANRVTDKVALPINIIREEDGSSTIEVAVVGKTADDLEVKGVTENGNTFLVINTKDTEKPAGEDKRTYTVRKIKGSKISIKVLVPSRLDLAKAVKTVENGLLTVKIPVAQQEEKPLEFNI